MQRGEQCNPQIGFAGFLLVVFAVLLWPLTALEAAAQEESGKYYTKTTVTGEGGETLQEIVIHGPPTPPPGFELQRQPVALPAPNPAAGVNVLEVPAFNWVYGCSAVSAAMIAAYYDRNGFPDIYTGPTNGGLMPLNNSSWPTWTDGSGATYPGCPLIASRQGQEGRASRGSIDDYWVSYASYADDPYITGGWDQHTWEDAIGDYMKTGRSIYHNVDGGTAFYFNPNNNPAPMTCAELEARGIAHDGTAGQKLFYEARGYAVTACYNQITDNRLAGGFSFADFKAEIDAGRPVMLQLAGHSIVGIGYDDAANLVYIHDTWDYSNHVMTWGGSYAGMALDGVNVINLARTYTVTFASSGGSAVPSQKVAENGTVVRPADPTRPGYDFAGWYSDSDLTVPFDFATPIAADITLYANWNVSTYTVSGVILEGGVSGPPIAGATIAIGSRSTTTSNTGNFSITGFTAGSYVVLISKPGYLPQTTSNYAVSGDISDAIFFLLPDSTAPTVTGFSVPDTSRSLNVPITTFTVTDNVGVTGYLITETSIRPMASDSRWRSSKPASHTFTTYGIKTLHAWAKDAAGNVSAYRSETVAVIDALPPTVTGFAIPASWNSLTVPLATFTAMDNVAVKGYLVTERSLKPLAADPRWKATKPASYTFAGYGNKILFAWAKDAAGNVSAYRYDLVVVKDALPPAVTAFAIPASWNALTVPLATFTAVDNVGVKGYLVTERSLKPLAGDPRWKATKPASYTFASYGNKILFAWAKDAAGNVSAYRYDQVLVKDALPPAVTAFTIPATSNSLTIPVTTFTATDNVGVNAYLVTQTSTKPLAGDLRWRSSRPTYYSFTSAGVKTLYAWAKDIAGNVSACRSDSVTIALPR